MKTTHLTAIALAAVVLGAPTAAQAATDEPTKSASKLSGLPPLSQVLNQKAKKKRRPTRVRARSAWMYDGPAGSPGEVTEATPVHFTEYRQSVAFPNGMGGVFYQYTWAARVANTAGLTVSRSPATSGAQDVNLIYALQVWDGSQWVQHMSVRRVSQIPAGYAVTRTPLFDAYPTPAFRGYVRVAVGIVWFVAGTNTLLGWTHIVPHLGSDHVCATSARPCAPYLGYVRLGSALGGW